VEILENVTSCFDCEAVVGKEVGGWKASQEEKILRVVQSSHWSREMGWCALA